MAREGEVTDEEVDRVTAAITEELATLPPTTSLPALLTASDTRAALATVIAAELPLLRVLSYDELPATVNVMPVARITLS